MVLLRRVAYDVVMEERHRDPLGDVGLWRDYIEGVNCGFGCREKWGVDKRHLDLDPVHPNHLEAGRNSAIIIAIRNACGLGMGNGCKDDVRAVMVIMAMRIRVVFSEWVIFLRVLFLIEHKRLCLFATTKDI